MATTIDQQVALDESLVPSTQRLRIGRSNFRLPSDIQSKESTLQVVYDVLWNSPLFRAFQLTADVPEIYISFASVINKCLTGKSSGVDSFRLSQAQMLWGFYHRINIDFAYLIWEDFVYQVEHKNQKRSNEMNYPRFTKVIIDYFMIRKPSISRRNRINWHYIRDDALFSTIKVVSRHQTTQQYGAILPIELTLLLPLLLLLQHQQLQTPEESEEESNDEGDQELRLSEEARIQEEEDADELYREAPIQPPTIPSIILDNLPTFNLAFRFEERL
nr:hypothetical protein [Tanacetum cinerariifolium]